MLIHFCCLCPLGLATKPNFNISKVVHCLTLHIHVILLIRLDPPWYFKIKTISLGSALQSCTICYFLPPASSNYFLFFLRYRGVELFLRTSILKATILKLTCLITTTVTGWFSSRIRIKQFQCESNIIKSWYAGLASHRISIHNMPDLGVIPGGKFVLSRHRF